MSEVGGSAYQIDTTSCPVCSAAGVDHNEMMSRLRSSFFWTAYYLCQWDDLSFRLHKAICDRVQLGIERGERKFLIMIPRGHFKSSLMSVAYPIWRLINDPARRILIVMSSSKLATDKMAQVRDIVTRLKVFRHFFEFLTPEFREQKITADEITLPRDREYGEPSVRALGVTSKVVGGHYNDIIGDDIVDGLAEDSDVQMSAAIRWVRRSNPLFVDRARGILIIIGTLWPGGLYEMLLADTSYTKIHLGCYVDDRYREFMSSCGVDVSDVADGTPIFPERENLESLHTAREDMGDYNFSHQMLNVIADDSMRTFHRSDIVYFSHASDAGGVYYSESGKKEKSFSPYSDMYRTLTIDPATGEHKGTDQSAITVCGQDRLRDVMFVLDTWQGRVLPDVLIDRIIDMYEEWQCHVAAPEDVAFQKTLKTFLAQRTRERNVNMYIRPVKPGAKSKAWRIINSLQPFVRRRKLRFTSDQTELIREMLDLQIVDGKRILGRSPNLLDSLAYHVEFWRSSIIKNPNEGIDDIKDASLIEPEVPLYGLECYT